MPCVQGYQTARALSKATPRARFTIRSGINSSSSGAALRARGAIDEGASAAAASAVDHMQVARAATAGSAMMHAILYQPARKEPVQAGMLAVVYYSGAPPQRPRLVTCTHRCGVTPDGGTRKKSRQPRSALTKHLHSTFD